VGRCWADTFCVPPKRYCWEGKDFGFNHKIMIKVQELPLGIMVTMNNMVYKSPGKGLVVHEEDVSVPLAHPT
jgi:hypothetical protein